MLVVKRIAICFILICASFVSAQSIPLLVQERAGIARSNEPVTVAGKGFFTATSYRAGSDADTG